MPVAPFTGADLRDWHRDHFDAAEHASMCAFLHRDELFSWERIALWLRASFPLEVLDELVATPAVLEVVLRGLLFGFGQGAQYANQLWFDAVGEPAA